MWAAYARFWNLERLLMWVGCVGVWGAYSYTHVGGPPHMCVGRLRTVLEIVSRLRRSPDTARVVTGTRKFDCGLGHDELHWLDVPDRVFFKLVHRCLNGRAPVGLLRPGRQC